MTAVYAVLDQETGEFTYANAGHNPPIWIQDQGQVEKLTRTGIALGVLGANPISQRKILINPGESVLLYTDGVTEAFSPEGSLFGEPRLIEIVRSNCSDTAKNLLNAVDSGLDGFIGPSPLSDDLTMLVIKRK